MSTEFEVDEPARRHGLAGWPHPDASRFVTSGSQRWHVQRFGDAPETILLLHGTGASTHSWRDVAPRLSARFTVWAVDLPGHGLSEALPPRARSLAGMAAATAGLLQALDVVPVAVAGHSAGAALALRMLLDGRLPAARAIVGLNPALLPFEGWAGVFYAPMARALALSPLVPWAATWAARDAASVRRLIASTGSHIDEAGAAYYAQLLRRPGHVAGVLAMMANWDLAGLARDLPAVRVPLQLVAGAADRTVPLEQVRRAAARVPGAAVEVLQGLGHLAHEEAPERVTRTMLQHFG